jgi:hypothetical protein
MALKREYVNVLFRPFSKIRLIWVYFETEPDTGFFWSTKGSIEAQIEPGLDALGGIAPTPVPGLAGFPLTGQIQTKPVFFRNSPLLKRSFLKIPVTLLNFF